MSAERAWRDGGKMKVLAAASLAVVFAGLLVVLWRMCGSASAAYEEKLRVERELTEVGSRAAKLPLEKARAEDARLRWRAARAPYERSQETGALLRDIEEKVVSCGMLLLAVEPKEAVEKPYRGHLRAVVVDVRVEGTYPQLVDLLAAWERMGPVEVRRLKVEQAESAPGGIRAEASLAAYSLNPPHRTEAVDGASGRYDAFSPPASFCPGAAGEGPAGASEKE